MIGAYKSFICGSRTQVIEDATPEIGTFVRNTSYHSNDRIVHTLTDVLCRNEWSHMSDKIKRLQHNLSQFLIFFIKFPKVMSSRLDRLKTELKQSLFPLPFVTTIVGLAILLCQNTQRLIAKVVQIVRVATQMTTKIGRAALWANNGLGTTTYLALECSRFAGRMDNFILLAHLLG
jgi:hypothetical protein